jgi:hypothetical protein
MATWMFEVYYSPPSDPAYEAGLTDVVATLRGRLDYREAPEVDASPYVCLTFEFDSEDAAVHAAELLRSQGHRAKTVCQYS